MAIPFPYLNFSGGLNTRDADFLLTDSQARDLNNVQGTAAGAIVKRPGLRSFGTSPATMDSLFACEATASSFLIAHNSGGTSLYSIDLGGTYTAIKTGLSHSNPWEWVTSPVVSAQGPLFGMNGGDTPQQWDGVAGTTSNWTNATGSVHVPNGTMCCLSQNQVFVAGTTTTPTGMTAAPDALSRLYWSAIGDPTNWDPASLTGAGFADFDPEDGSPITAIGIVGPYVMVFKPRKMWILVDTTTATIRRVSNNIGCPAHRSLATGPAGTYFLSEDRVYLTNGSSLQSVSDIIQPTVDGISPALRAQAAGVCFNNHYYLSVSTNASNNNLVLDWDETLKSWWKHSFGSNQWTIWHSDPDGAGMGPNLFSAKATSAVVDHAFDPAALGDNGSAMTWSWTGPWQSPSFYRRRLFPTPFFRKRLRQFRVIGSGTVDFSLATDLGNPTLLHSNVFAGGVPFARFYSLGVANAFSVKFSATSLTADKIDEYVLYVLDRRDSQVN